VTGGDPEQLRKFFDLYFTQADEMIEQLQQAIVSGSVGDVQRLAHKLKGASVTCGMTSIISSLHKLEQLAFQGKLSDLPAVFAQTTQAYERIQQFLNATKPV
jgi:HPt (histidine-containing phosphotransfer) domain-containing protein